MDMTITKLRSAIRAHYLADESATLTQLIEGSGISETERTQASNSAADLVRQVRASSKPTLMENFLAEYGLSTKEGVALMCLAEALLRVPDAHTIDKLIEDKVAFGQWRDHIGKSTSGLVNSSTWALMLTGKLISPATDPGLNSTIKGVIKRLGEPVVRVAVAQAMKELGRQFVLGQDIHEALKRAAKLEDRGYTYSYDMLGEAARTEHDALKHFNDYKQAIATLAPLCTHAQVAENPGISVKLSALHPRYEFAKQERVKTELVDRTRRLAIMAAEANMGFNIDAEEADRLDLSLDIIESVLRSPELEGWQGFGVVVQAFGQRASFVIEWLYALANQLDRKIMVRLVKGAYWDAEIKRAQTLGLEGFPVYTRKVHSDVSFLCCAKNLLSKTDRIYPQFATHNAYSVAAVMTLAKGLRSDSFEFQRLHGMGESLHDIVHGMGETRCRIYAPVGQHQDLLAYLVRRLLENGANSSFVNQIVDTSISPEQIAKDPFVEVKRLGGVKESQVIVKPKDLFGAHRCNAKGWDLTDPLVVADLEKQRNELKNKHWQATPLLAQPYYSGNENHTVTNPADPNDIVGQVTWATDIDVDQAITDAVENFPSWAVTDVETRASALEKVADLYEHHAAEFFVLATREAGKTLADAVGEVREAVDFARYYAQQIRQLSANGHLTELQSRGVITCISPWNFPLAIFTGQILAAIAAGNAVLAKPAEQSPLIAARAVELMHEAGIPKAIIQLLPGTGATVGARLTSDPRINGVCFTGSTQTAQTINRAMAKNLAPHTPLIAETGGLNAMLVDSTALPEQVVRDVVASAFQSAGQRCSALRILYVQEDIADNLLAMLFGAMDELSLGDPWYLSTDIGPVIDQTAQQKIERHCQKFANKGQVLKSLVAPEHGRFVAPTVIKVLGIDDLEEEIFGPVLHVATYKADQVEAVIESINSKNYGLTFGLHSRMDTRLAEVSAQIHVGNTYVNRNQIGAIVGSQPFGGEGLSGTGPKAGGPAYVKRFFQPTWSEIELTPLPAQQISGADLADSIDKLVDIAPISSGNEDRVILADLFKSLGLKLPESNETVTDLPGPTGELNRLSRVSRGTILCIADSADIGIQQACMGLATGNKVILVTPELSPIAERIERQHWPVQVLLGALAPELLEDCEGIKAVISHPNARNGRAFRIALAKRDGELIPFVTEYLQVERYRLERHLCIDTTAAGGNASLIAAAE
ncbi:bifunctional proline dehydrogenase/L-glutamate gamma-semialdehyde dehydrogenase PutA [Reinekea sp. G2M2-21]|uniref:bifunctional proline dehydrogenase/L-glutamate gamma-semialdehyde dehydrogenase PutA n=1 Tax=Reinekea sp. G2M2-21 TaxID=2788942 RepID=UPI0018A8840A|nr:bifunctional proline dehydrogenase/L-glutamate gamma-semialdehyde dehydrogenase PutA [Reinekea sp. G2M2-21]